MSNTTYAYPSKDIGTLDVLFTLPMKYTDGSYINIFLITWFTILFIGGIVYKQGVRASALYASYGTFGVTFILTLLSAYTSQPIAGGNQLIASVILVIFAIIWNRYSRGAGL